MTLAENRDVTIELAERLQDAVAGRAEAEQVVSGLGYLLRRGVPGVPVTSSSVFSAVPEAVTVASTVRTMRAASERVAAVPSVASSFPAAGTATVTSGNVPRLSTFASGPSRLFSSSRVRPPVHESSFITVPLSR